MTEVWVDPSTLRELAKKADESARVADTERVDRKVSGSCDGLPGSSLQWAARRIADQLTPEVTDFAASARQTSDGVAGAAKDYRMTDEQAAAALTKAWPK